MRISAHIRVLRQVIKQSRGWREKLKQTVRVPNVKTAIEWHEIIIVYDEFELSHADDATAVFVVVSWLAI